MYSWFEASFMNAEYMIKIIRTGKFTRVNKKNYQKMKQLISGLITGDERVEFNPSISLSGVTNPSADLEAGPRPSCSTL